MPRGRASAPSEFLAGARLVFRGFRMWGRRPGLMWLGVLPALIVFVIFAGLLALVAVNVETIADAVTPFADAWSTTASGLVRVFVGAGILIGSFVVAAYTFTALTLIVGDPFYERIWKAAEEEMGGFQEAQLGFWRSAGDAVALLLRSAGAGILTAAVGLIPLVGQVAAPVLGVLFAGHVLARELTGRPFEARGMPAAARRELRRGRRARELGFGVMTQLFYLVPGGAILVMPAAVVGATHLARTMLESEEGRQFPPVRPAEQPPAAGDAPRATG